MTRSPAWRSTARSGSSTTSSSPRTTWRTRCAPRTIASGAASPSARARSSRTDRSCSGAVSAAEPTREQLAANRRLWDERVPVHYASDFYGVAEFKKGAKRIRPLELAELGEVRGKDLLHLQCHFGLDTLDFARLGARVTGVDFSEPAVEQARALAADVGLEARFVVSDVLELD